MKKGLKIFLIVIAVLFALIVVDTLQAKLLNNSPLLKIREHYNGGETSYIDKGLLVNHYYCNNKEEKTLFKTSKYACPAEFEVKEIVDTTKDIKDFVCAEALEEFYRDDDYVYYYSCIKSKYILVRYTHGYEETVEEALKNKRITIKDLDDYEIGYHKEPIDKDEISDNYIAVFHGGAGEIVYETYIYKIDNNQANYGFSYINVTRTTKSYGSDEWNTKITKKGEVSWTDDVFQVAEKNNAYSYVTLPGDNKTYTIEEFMPMFLMN